MLVEDDGVGADPFDDELIGVSPIVELPRGVDDDPEDGVGIPPLLDPDVVGTVPLELMLVGVSPVLVLP